MNAKVSKRYILEHPENWFSFWFTHRIYYIRVYCIIFVRSVVWPFVFQIYWPWIRISESNGREMRSRKKSIPEHNYLFHYQATMSRELWIWIKRNALVRRTDSVSVPMDCLPSFTGQQTIWTANTPNMAGTIHNTQIGKYQKIGWINSHSTPCSQLVSINGIIMNLAVSTSNEM